MALVVDDRIKETTTTTNTSSYSLGGAVSGFQTFSDGVGSGNTTYYCCTDGTDYEVGLGTLSGTTLARTTILESSNSNSAVSWSAGSKDIFCTLPASKAVFKDASNNVTVPNALIASSMDATTGGFDNLVLNKGAGFVAPIIWEGSTQDDYETTLNVVDPTADRTISLPDASGTVALNDVATTSANGLMSSSDKSKLDGVATSANNYSHPNHSGDVTSAGDGATTIANDAVTYAKMQNVAANNVLLGNDNGVNSAVQELTASDVRSIINVEDGATADQTAAEILTAIKTVDGAASGLDADTLDGQHASAFLTAHPTISAASSSDNSGRTYIQDITLDSNGHVTNIATATETVVNTDTNTTSLAIENGSGTSQFTVTDTVGLEFAASGATSVAFDATNKRVTFSSTDNNTTYSAATTSTDGLMSSSDKTKLDGVESNATADQTGAEIKTAYENEADTNAFTDALLTKLNGIEASADVTDSTNVQSAGALMDSEVTNLAQVKAFDASNFATWQQGNNADAALLRTGGTMTGNIVMSGAQTVDGRDLSVDGAKLDGIEANADVTDAINVQAAGALMDSELTYEAAVKAINQDLSTTGIVQFLSVQAPTVYIPNAGGSGLLFEGSTADIYETSVVATDPTADRTITLPDQTGTAMLWQNAWPDDPASDNIAIGSSALSAVTTSIQNVAIGPNTLSSSTTAGANTAVGYNALSLATSNNNTAVGNEALGNSTSGGTNTAVGSIAGRDLTTGSRNTAMGNAAMRDNTTDSDTTAIGYWCGGGDFLTGGTYLGAYAGNYDSDGKDYQVAIGYNAMNDCDGDECVAVGAYAMSDGNHYRSVAVGHDALGRSSSYFPYYNVAVGYGSMNAAYYNDYNTLLGYDTDVLGTSDSRGVAIGVSSRTTSDSISIGYQCMYSALNTSTYNICMGYRAGYDLDGGDHNFFAGYRSGYSGGTGSHNIAIGYYSINSLSSGNNNIGFGQYALGAATTGSDNVAIGQIAAWGITTGNNNTFVGARAGYQQDGTITNRLTTGSNCTLIGHEAMPSSGTATNEITLGDNNITSLRCNVQTISSLSDERDKTAISDIPYGLDFINDMRPVQFTWNRRDGSLGAKPDIGFIAQELNDVELDHSSSSRTRLVNWENPEKLEADYVRSYPILVKAVQELSAKCDALEARLAALEGA